MPRFRRNPRPRPRTRAKHSAPIAARRAPRPAHRGRPRVALLVGALLAVAAVVGGGIWIYSTSITTSSTRNTASVTPVALPDFSQAPKSAETTNEIDVPPDIGTPTPGVAGPTPVVVTSSPWQVLVAPRAVADMTSPSGL